MSKIVLLNKPYGVISQFRAHAQHSTLAQFVSDTSLRIAGRLDTDSEGLMLLTDDGQVNAAMTQPRKHYKTYHVQVEGKVTCSHISRLEEGVLLKDGITLPAKVKTMGKPDLWARNPPIRFRKTVPTSWLSLRICEGRNRQVRRMTAAVGLPTLRLVRVQVGEFTLDALQPGQWVQINLSKRRRDKLLTVAATH